MSKASWRFLELARADASFEARGDTLDEVFEAAGRALTELMVEPGGLRPVESRRVEVESDGPEGLLYEFLQELVFLKDVDRLLFCRFVLRIRPRPWRLEGRLEGEPADPERHKLGVDVKAVTLHEFKLVPDEAGWTATVVVDI